MRQGPCRGAGLQRRAGLVRRADHRHHRAGAGPCRAQGRQQGRRCGARGDRDGRPAGTVVMSEKGTSGKTATGKSAATASVAKDGGKAAAKRGDVRSRGRELALQLLYSFEQNKFIDDGMLVPADATDGLEPETVAFAQALQAGFAKERQAIDRSEEHTSELQSRLHLVCRLLLEKKNKKK